jgi:hypothetical protein
MQLGIRMNKGVQLTLLLISSLPLAIVSSGTLSEQNLSEENAQIVQQEYARLYQSDIPAMLSAMSQNVMWIDPGASNVPYAGSYTGQEQVEEFLTKLRESIEFMQLDPLSSLLKFCPSLFRVVRSFGYSLHAELDLHRY